MFFYMTKNWVVEVGEGCLLSWSNSLELLKRLLEKASSDNQGWILDFLEGVVT